MKSLVAAAGTIGVNIDDTQIERFRRYRELLVEWGRRVNLTAVKDPEAVVEQLFIRSFRIAVPAGGTVSTAGWFDGRRIIDIGSGAGIPGLPLKIILPAPRSLCWNPTVKSATSCGTSYRNSDFEGVTVLNSRAEDAGRLKDHRESYDLATARGVSKLPILAEYTLPFLKLGGVAVLPKGHDREAVQGEVEDASFAANELGAAPAIIQPVAHPGTSPMDHIIYWLKVQPTKDRYPRRPGIPAKRPLSAD